MSASRLVKTKTLINIEKIRYLSLHHNNVESIFNWKEHANSGVIQTMKDVPVLPRR